MLRRRAVPRRLVDQAFDLYLAWLQESAAVQAAYDHWRDAGAEERGTRHAVYAAALDREERAGHAYAETIARATAIVERGARAWVAAGERGI
jgi:hypothetical protein